jgi:hypothetical protein
MDIDKDAEMEVGKEVGKGTSIAIEDGAGINRAASTNTGPHRLPHKPHTHSRTHAHTHSQTHTQTHTGTRTHARTLTHSQTHARTHGAPTVKNPRSTCHPYPSCNVEAGPVRYQQLHHALLPMPGRAQHGRVSALQGLWAQESKGGCVQWSKLGGQPATHPPRHTHLHTPLHTDTCTHLHTQTPTHTKLTQRGPKRKRARR